MRLFDDSLNGDEVKFLYFEKYSPNDIIVDLEVDDRNYIETITRTFKHKLQGSKSNLINLYINNSLITEKSVQDMYNTIILKELKPHLPAYVKINKIVWQSSIESSEKMMSGNFNIKNTITDSGNLNVI